MDADAVSRLWLGYLNWGNEGLHARFGFRLPVQELVERDLASMGKFLPPEGRLLLAFEDGEAIGTAALQSIGPSTAEIKRMWISPESRGLGLGRRLLKELEACALSGGARIAHIETSAVLTEALALYRSNGWVEVPKFNDEPFADHWLEKSLS